MARNERGLREFVLLFTPYRARSAITHIDLAAKKLPGPLQRLALPPAFDTLSA